MDAYRTALTHIAICAVLFSSNMHGQEPAQSPKPSIDPLRQMPAVESEQLKSFVAGLIRQNIPEHYVNEKDWGHEKRIYAGVKIWRDGWKLETKRRWNDVNHGAWTRYAIDLVDPNENLQIRLHKLRWVGDGTSEFELTMTGALHCVARRSRWNYGVQLWSISVDADAQLSITVSGTLGVDFDYKNIPPDLVIVPHVEKATIQVPHFEVNRISHIGGDVAEGVGKALESLLKKEIIERQQVKLVERMNRQIKRKEDSLRLSMSDWLNSVLTTKKDLELEAPAK